MFAFIATLLVGSIGTAGAQVNYTVYDGTNTSNYIPVYGYYCDNYLKCEYVMPADHLDAINGSTISALKFYTSTASATWGAATFQVFLKEIASPNISTFQGTEDATVVYEGSLSVSNNEMTINFTTPYTYNGGNLLVGIYNLSVGSYTRVYFYGQTISGASVYGNNGTSLNNITNAYSANFIPKTTFTVDQLHGCITPTNLAVSDVTTYGATVTWTPGNTETEWVVKFNDLEFNTTTPSYTATTLDPETDYVASVKAVCGGTEESEYTTPGVLFTTLPTCPAPTAVTVSNITTTSADIAWTNGGGENAWTIDYNGTEIAADSNPFTLTGLTSATDYTVKVKANCDVDDESAWSGATDFRTACATVVVDDENPMVEGFEGDDLGCWTSEIIEGTYNWTISTNYPQSGNHSVYFSFSGLQARLISPIMDLTGITTQPRLSFYHRQSAWYGSVDAMDVYYRTAADADWTLLENYSTEYATMTYEEFVLPNPTATYQIAFVSNADDNYGIYLDDITVDAAPSCVKPTAVTVSNITTTTADIAWTDGDENAWTIDVNGTEVDADSNPFTLTGLNPSTNYTVKVKAICSDEEQSEWSATITFTTACGALTLTETESYSENFDSYTATSQGNAGGVIPNCWGIISNGTNANTHPCVSTSYVPTTSNNGLNFRSGGSTYTNCGTINIAYLPEFTNPQGAVVTFTYRMENASYGTLSVGYVTDLNDVTSFVSAASVTSSTSAANGEVSIPTTIPAGARIAFQWEENVSTSFYDCGIDNLVVSVAPDCPKPTNVTVNNITPFTAEVAWTNGGDENAWTIDYNGTEIAADNNPFTLTGLTSETSYTVKVKANCSEESESDWSATTNFTTLISCPRPTAVTVDSITETTAEISWTNGGSESAWMIDYNGTEIEADSNPFTLTGLNHSTTYTIKVKAVCSEEDSSSWSNTTTFATVCATIVVSEANPFTEDFNSITSGIPACWDNAEGNATYPWEYTASGVTGACVRFNSYTNSANLYNLLKTPVLDLTAVNVPMLTFTHKNPSAAQSFEVMYTTDGGATYTTIATGLQGASAWTTEEIVVSALANTENVMFVFKGVSNYGYGDDYIYLDDVMVGEAPACPKPIDVLVSNITETTADIAWTETGSATEWTILLDSTEIAADSNSFTLTGLTASTQYTVQVKANCAEESESDWSTAVSFRTSCATVVVTDEEPFTDGFETYEAEDFGCWENQGTDQWSIATDEQNAGAQSAYLDYDASATYLISPVMDLTGITTVPQLSFYHQQQLYIDDWWGDEYVDYLYVYYRTDASAAWTLIGTYEDAYETFTQETIVLPYANATYQIAFKGIGNDGYGIYIDDVVVEAGPSCVAPFNVTVNEVYQTSAQISWTPMTEAPSYEVAYGDTIVVTTDTMINLTDLVANTDYTVRVRALCDATDTSDWSAEVSFSTNLCIPAPTSVDNSGIVNVTFGQTQIVNNSTHPTSAPFYGDYTAQVGDAPASTDVTVEITYNTHYTYGTIIWVNWNNDMQFTDDEVVYTGTSSSTYPTTLACTFHVPATAELGTYTMRIAGADMYFDSQIAANAGFDPCYTGTYAIYEDYTIEVTETPTCIAPEVEVTNITDTTAEITLTTFTDETSWEVEVNGTASVVTENPFTLEGLTSNTDYNIRVRAICSATDTSFWSTMTQFTTECDAFITVPHTEGFENYATNSFPDCWTLIQGYTSYSTVYPYVYGYSAHTGSNCLYMYTYGSTTMNHVAMPAVQNITDLQVSFFAKGSSSYTSNLIVGVMDGTTFDAVDTIVLTTGSYTSDPYVVYFNNYTGNGNQIAFKLVPGASTGYTYLDDVVIDYIPSCLPVTNVAATALNHGVEVSWTANGDEAEWEINIEGVLDTVVSSNPVTIMGLDASSTFTVSVRAICSATDSSSWVGNVQFTTPCDVIVVTDNDVFTEGFEGTSMPNCWNEEAEDIYTWNFGTHYNIEDAYAGTSYAYFTGASFGHETSMLISPVLDITAVTVPTLIYAHTHDAWGSDQNVLNVYYRKSAVEAWTLLTTHAEDIDTWSVDTILLPSPTATYQIAFEGIANYGYPIGVDGVYVGPNDVPAAPCDVPTNLAVANNVATWTSNAANFNLTYIVGNDTTTVTVAGNTYTFEGLADSAQVSVMVQAVCDQDNISDWTDAVNFTFTVGVANYNTIRAKVFPNPTTGKVNVECSVVNADVNVYDMFGKLLMNGKIANERTELDFSAFAPGVYVVRIANADSFINVKVVKE